MREISSFYHNNVTEKVAMKATPTTDYLGALVGSLVPGSYIANLIGAQYGMLDKNRTDQKSVAKSFIPGVGVSRLVNRLKSQVGKEVEDTGNSHKDKDARPVRHALSELFGSGTSLLATTGVGAGIGKLLGNTRRGAAIGASVGGSGILLGSLLAAIKRRRSAQDQIDNDKKTVLKDLLIPGVGAYNKFKRMGRSQGDRDEKENKKSSTKKAYVIGFSKTAEAYGVDPYILLKFAGMEKAPGVASRLWGTVKGFFSRAPKGRINVDRSVSMFEKMSPKDFERVADRIGRSAQFAVNNGKLSPQVLANLQGLIGLGSAHSAYSLGPKTPAALKALQQRISEVRKAVAAV